MRHTVLLAVILGDLGPEEKQERETDGKVFHPCLHMQIAATFPRRVFPFPPTSLVQFACQHRGAQLGYFSSYTILKRVAFFNGFT